MQNREVKREARAISAVSRKTDGAWIWGDTVPNRYKGSVDVLAELARKRKSKKLVVHLVGVGYDKGPQLREVISALTKKAGKRVSVHVMDFSKMLLRRAMKAARKEFPGIEMTAYFLDKKVSGTGKRFNIAKAMALPREKADIIVCTNVIRHLEQPSTHLALYQLASSLKKGGHLLIGEYDVKQLVKPRYSDFGLARKKLPILLGVEFDLPLDRGAIFRKVSKEKPFNVILNKIKGWER
jgi:hypothetical protein